MAAETRCGDKARLHLCALGNARSVHVARRVCCFAARGHRVTLLSKERAELPGVEVWTPPPRPRLPRLLRGTLLVRDLVRQVRRLNPDLVQVHYAAGPFAWAGALAGVRPLVLGAMGGDVLGREQAGTGAAWEFLNRRAWAKADCFFAKSPYLAAELRRRGCDKQRIEVVVWGIDADRYAPGDREAARRELHLPPERTLVLSPRHVQQLYNIDVILEACARLRERRPEFLLAVILSAPEADYLAGLRRMVEERGLSESVFFAPAVEQSQMRLWYQAADLVVSLAASDGIPQSMLEAQACGTPILVSRLPHYAGVFTHGENAWLTEIRPEAAAEALERLLADADLRAKLAREGTAWVAEHADMSREVERAESMYYELCAGCGRGKNCD